MPDQNQILDSRTKRATLGSNEDTGALPGQSKFREGSQHCALIVGNENATLRCRQTEHHPISEPIQRYFLRSSEIDSGINTDDPGGNCTVEIVVGLKTYFHFTG